MNRLWIPVWIIASVLLGVPVFAALHEEVWSQTNSVISPFYKPISPWTGQIILPVSRTGLTPPQADLG